MLKYKSKQKLQNQSITLKNKRVLKKLYLNSNSNIKLIHYKTNIFVLVQSGKNKIYKIQLKRFNNISAKYNDMS